MILLSTLIKEQNDGLASELESFSFKPRINQTSLDLSATMKSLSSRIPELVAEKDKVLEAKRRELKAQEVAGNFVCSSRFDGDDDDIVMYTNALYVVHH